MPEKTVTAKVTVSRQLKGADGAPGVSPVVYDLVMTPDAWNINPDGTPTISGLPRIMLFRTSGGERTDFSHVIGNVGNFRLEVIADGKDVSSGILIPATGYVQCPIKDTSGKAYKTITVNFFKQASSSSDWTLCCSRTCSIGQDGMPGKVRAPLRMTDWAKDQAGMQFYTGEGDDDPWTDLVWTRQGDTVLWYQCIASHSKAADEDPATDTTLWRAASRFSLVASDIVLAKDAVIDHLIASRVIAAANPLEPSGKRIEILPDTKEMKIYDEDNRLRSTFSGDVKSPKGLLSGTGTNWDVNITDDVEWDSMGGNNVSTGWVTAATLQVNANSSSVISGKISAQAARTVIISQGSQGGQGDIVTPTLMQSASVFVSVRLIDNKGNSYGTDSVEAHSPSDLGGGVAPDKREKTYVFNPVFKTACTVSLQYQITISYNTNSAQSVYAQGVFCKPIGGTLGTDLSHTEYFANGWRIQRTTNDYILSAWDETDGMVFQMENKNGHGLKVDKDGVKYKSSNSAWKALT